MSRRCSSAGQFLKPPRMGSSADDGPPKSFWVALVGVGGVTGFSLVLVPLRLSRAHAYCADAGRDQRDDRREHADQPAVAAGVPMVRDRAANAALSVDSQISDSRPDAAFAGSSLVVNGPEDASGGTGDCADGSGDRRCGVGGRGTRRSAGLLLIPATCGLPANVPHVPSAQNEPPLARMSLASFD